MICPHCGRHISSWWRGMLGVGFKITDLRCQRCQGPIALGVLVWVILGISAALGGVAGFWAVERWFEDALTPRQAALLLAGLTVLSLIIGAASWLTLHAKPRR